MIKITQGRAPLIVSIPHAGTDIPTDLLPSFTSLWHAQRDCDWWIDHLYDFVADLGATMVYTPISRSIIDVNRDPTGASLYPGQATTDLCPLTDFDGDPLYHPGAAPGDAEIAERRQLYYAPYHAALTREIARLRAIHPHIVVYDAHSIRSYIPRLFEGLLPQFNIGTFNGASCDPALEQAVLEVCAQSGQTHVLNGRFKGGHITRHYGNPGQGVHAIQMELACRGYMTEPGGPVMSHTWPSPYIETQAAPMRGVLMRVLHACLDFTASFSSDVKA